jgi:gliding motility-associated lipoprotein GldD
LQKPYITRLTRLVLICISVLYTIGCGKSYTPKPRAYFRIELPPKDYVELKGDFPYVFDIPTYAAISHYEGRWEGTDTAEYWINIEYPQFHSRLHLTYKKVNNNLAKLIDDAYTFAFKHSIKADAINQREYLNPGSNVYGILYDIKGNTASSLQFFVTDSTRNFLRGALYFDNEPNKDSIAPVNDFLRKDVERMIETLKWKN